MVFLGEECDKKCEPKENQVENSRNPEWTSLQEVKGKLSAVSNGRSLIYFGRFVQNCIQNARMSSS